MTKEIESDGHGHSEDCGFKKISFLKRNEKHANNNDN